MTKVYAKWLNIGTRLFCAAFAVYGIAITCFLGWPSPGADAWANQGVTVIVFGGLAVLMALVDRDVQARVTRGAREMRPKPRHTKKQNTLVENPVDKEEGIHTARYRVSPSGNDRHPKEEKND